MFTTHCERSDIVRNMCQIYTSGLEVGEYLEKIKHVTFSILYSTFNVVREVKSRVLNELYSWL
jgi:hypothetical protein